MTKYLRFVIESEKIWGSIGDRDRRVFIAVHYHYAFMPKPLHATELLQRHDLGSAAVVHASIKRLREGGYLKLSPDKVDQRVKHLSITTKGAQLLERLNKLL